MDLNFNPASFGITSSNDFGGHLDTDSAKETKAKDAGTPQNTDAYKAAEQNATKALTQLSQASRNVAADGTLDNNFVRGVTGSLNASNQLSAFSSQAVEQAASSPDKELKYKIAQRVEDIMSAGIDVMYIFMNLISGQANGKFDEMKRKAEISADAKEQSSIVDGIMAGLDTPDDTAELSPEVIAYMRENNILVDGKTIDEFLKIGASNPEAVVAAAMIQKLEDLISKSVNGNGQGTWARGLKDIIDFMDKHGITIHNDTVYGTWKVSDYIDRLTGGNDFVRITASTMKAMLESLKNTVFENTHVNKTQLTQIKGAIDNVSNRAGDFVTQSQLELQKLMQLFSLLTNQISTLQTKKKDDIGTITRGMG